MRSKFQVADVLTTIIKLSQVILQPIAMVWPFSSSTSPTGDSESSITEEKGRKLQAVEDVAKARETREQRKRKLIEAVNENCALEGAALLECQDSWSLWNRMTLCQSFQSRYMECMNTQRVLYLCRWS